MPQISTDNIAPSGVTGMQSSSLDLKIGLSILGNVLKALTGTSLDVNARFKNTKSVTFEYKDVLEDHIELDELDGFLSASTFKQNLNMVRSAFVASNVFILTSAIKSKSITVKTQGEGGVSGNIEVPVIQNIASGKLVWILVRQVKGKLPLPAPRRLCLDSKRSKYLPMRTLSTQFLSPFPVVR
ncbi:MAG: hypothetical protein ACJ73N_10525 [Bryobacteraceae bacterium]